MKETEQILSQHGIAPTPVRMMVLGSLLNSDNPMSLSSIETLLETVDKSTISRCLALFRDHHLLHSFEDGSGSTKYEVCRSLDCLHHDDSHVHFRCEKCGQTICINSVSIPEVRLPEGYIVHELNYVISGVCGNCAIQS